MTREDAERLFKILRGVTQEVALPWRKQCYVLGKEAIESAFAGDWASALNRAARVKAKEQANLKAKGVFSEFCDALRELHTLEKEAKTEVGVPVEEPKPSRVSMPSPRTPPADRPRPAPLAAPSPPPPRAERATSPAEQPGPGPKKRARRLTEAEREYFTRCINQIGGRVLARAVGLDPGLVYAAAKGSRDILPAHVKAVMSVDLDAYPKRRVSGDTKAEIAKAKLTELIRVIVREELAALLKNKDIKKQLCPY